MRPIKDAFPRATMLTTKQAATVLGVSPKALENWRCAGKGPTYVRYSCICVRYPMDALLAFIDSRTVHP